MSTLRGVRRAAYASVASICLACTASAAKADVHWVIDNAIFDDGTTLNGYFNINVYGFLDGYDLKTLANGPFVAVDYTPSNSFFSNGTFYVDAQPGYQGDLHIEFANNLGVPESSNAIVGGDPPGVSYECQGSFSCSNLDGGATRFIASGVASAVPEPATWTMMLLGFAGLGFAGYRRTSARLSPQAV
jgi:PEP-CTERM motif